VPKPANSDRSPSLLARSPDGRRSKRTTRARPRVPVRPTTPDAGPPLSARPRGLVLVSRDRRSALAAAGRAPHPRWRDTRFTAEGARGPAWQVAAERRDARGPAAPRGPGALPTVGAFRGHVREIFPRRHASSRPRSLSRDRRSVSGDGCPRGAAVSPPAI